CSSAWIASSHPLLAMTRFGRHCERSETIHGSRRRFAPPHHEGFLFCLTLRRRANARRLEGLRCARQRASKVVLQLSLDCFVASAPRNDEVWSSLRAERNDPWFETALRASSP